MTLDFFRFNFKSALRNNLFLASIVYCRLLRKSQPKKGFGVAIMMKEESKLPKHDLQV